MNDSDDKISGRVFLIGAGPGDPDLITVKGLSLLQSSDVVVYDNLIPHELIVCLPENIEKVYVGKVADVHTLPQDEINDLLVKLASEGKKVARLKGGDPFIFGRGGEEAEYLREHNIDFEVIPGVTSGLAAPLSAGIPTTFRDKSGAVLLVTAHCAEKSSTLIDWEWISSIKQGTIIGYMGVRELPKVVKKLLDNGYSADTPSAIIERGCFPTQKIVSSRLEQLPQKASDSGIRPPAIFIIGDVVSLADKLDWFDRAPLSGIRIMVTRPADQSRWIYQMLRGLGAEVLTYPTIKTSFVNNQHGWQKFARCTHENRWLVFTSENCVRYFFGYLKTKKVDLRSIAGYKIAAYGSGTLRLLDSLGYRNDIDPGKEGMKLFAENLASQIDGNEAAVIRVKGNIRNDQVEEILSRTDADIISLQVYETITAEWQKHYFNRLKRYPPHVIMFTSGRSVDGFVKLLGEKDASEIASNAKIATIGPTTSAVVKEYNMQVEIEAVSFSIPDLIYQIADYFQNKSL